MMRTLPAIVTILLITSVNQASERAEFSGDSIISIAKKVSTSTMRGAVDWLHGAYFAGVASVYQMSQDPAILTRLHNWGGGHGWMPATNSLTETNADHQACCQTYCETYLAYRPADSSRMYQPWLRDWQYTSDVNTVHGRKLWSWADALFMAPPAVAMLGYITDSTRFYDSLTTFWFDASDMLYDSVRHLYYRDLSKRNDANPVFWSRGNGWVLAGLARVLKYLPENYPRRGLFEAQFKEMAAKIASLQPLDTLWHTSLLDTANYDAEMSGSSFFCYGLAWGINNHLLDRAAYEPIVRKAWTAMTRNVAANGSILRVQSEGGGPGPVSNTTTPYAEGAFMLAASEVYYMVNPTATRAITAKSQCIDRPDRLTVLPGQKMLKVPANVRTVEYYTLQGRRLHTEVLSPARVSAWQTLNPQCIVSSPIVIRFGYEQ